MHRLHNISLGFHLLLLLYYVSDMIKFYIFLKVLLSFIFKCKYEFYAFFAVVFDAILDRRSQKICILYFQIILSPRLK